jgi:hypothetical protein
VAGRAVEEPDSELALETANVLGERRLGDVHPFRRPAEMPFLRYRHEELDLA